MGKTANQLKNELDTWIDERLDQLIHSRTGYFYIAAPNEHYGEKRLTYNWNSDTWMVSIIDQVTGISNSDNYDTLTEAQAVYNALT